MIVEDSYYNYPKETSAVVVKPLPKSTGWTWTPTGRPVIPETPEKIIESTIATPGVGGVGGVAAIPKKFIAPLVGTGIGVGLGALLFGGGQTQDQQQEATITPTVTPTVDTTQNPTIAQLLEIINRMQQTSQSTTGVGDIGGGGYTYVGAPIGTTETQSIIYNITAPVTHSYQTTLAETHQTTTTTTTTTQEAAQKQGLDLVTIAIIGGIAILGMGVLK